MVATGDTLWDIAGTVLGAPTKWPEIYDANRPVVESAASAHGHTSSEHGHWIFPGTDLNIPGGACTQPPPPAPSSAAVLTDCSKPLLIGLRGSGQSAETLPQGTPLQQALGPEVSGVAEALDPDALVYGVPSPDYPASSVEELQAGAKPAKHMVDIALDVAKKLDKERETRELTSEVLENFQVTPDPDSVVKGANSLKELIRNRVAQCPHQKIMLSGYSQGAWVIRMALQALKQQPDVNWSEIEGAIAGIGLIADPYNKIFMPPVPEELESRTFKVCLPGDIVCNNPVDNYPSPKCDPFTILCPHVRYGTEQGAGGRTKIQEVADFLRTRLQ